MTARKQNPRGDSPNETSTKPEGLKRQAPESGRVLKSLDEALKVMEKPQKQTFEELRRQTLERCGC